MSSSSAANRRLSVLSVCRCLLVAFLAATTLTACSSREMYNAGQTWQRTECNRMLEPERSACLAQSSDDYDTYRKKREGSY